MTRILVLADTHMPRRGRTLHPSVLHAAEEADLIAHLGDFTGLEVVREIERLRPLVAVHGNNDAPEVRDCFPEELRLTIHDRRLALIHGHLGGRTAFQAALGVADADVVLFGHSHRARVAWEGKRLLLNPGSPTERRFAPFRSYAILTIGGDVRAEIVRLD